MTGDHHLRIDPVTGECRINMAALTPGQLAAADRNAAKAHHVVHTLTETARQLVKDGITGQELLAEIAVQLVYATVRETRDEEKAQGMVWGLAAAAIIQLAEHRSVL